jgi:AraC-like DNA-binding protein
MALSFSQQDYWEIVEDAFWESVASTPDAAAMTDFDDFAWPYPAQLGKGYFRKIQVREGIVLDFADYYLHDDVTITSQDREHPLELTFTLMGTERSNLASLQAGQHSFCGSGMAPGDVHHKVAHQRKFEVSIHIDPALLGQWTTGCVEAVPQPLKHLIKPTDHPYYAQVCATTLAMRQAVQQVLQCPFQGLTQRMYLESKVWELLALQLAQMPQIQEDKPVTQRLKAEDIERIHYAKDLLLSRLSNPPSLLELARLVGINDCKLKAGFRQVFGTTVFGYLQDCRMEKARQLLMAGEMTVADAAQAVGYANRSHFAIAFRKKFGINPSTYRRSQRKAWQMS